MNATTTTRREKADATRSRLLDVATKLFSEKGYHATSVDRIALRAGVAKGTFFVHFKSKDAVVAELVRIQTTAARAARARSLESGGSPIDALSAAVMTLAKHASSSRGLSRAVLAASLESDEVGGQASSMFDEVFAEMEADARAAKRAGLLAPGAEPRDLASALITAYLGAVLHFASDERVSSCGAALAPLLEANLAAHTIEKRRRK